MTMSAPVPTARTIELPPPGYPMVVMVITDDLTDNSKPRIHWVVSKAHPFVPDMNVMRMFPDREGYLEVYSVSSDGKAGMRDLVPMIHVRLAQEAMPLDVFAEELYDAEAGDDADDPDLDPGSDPDPSSAQPPVENGQVAS
jgi:hypothetical protein